LVTIKRKIGQELEVFEISESDLQQFKVGSVSTPQPSSNKDAIDLLKMEYETCAKRYNDLYSAAWTNFSYMALFAGGILTFGGTRFVTPLTAFLACLPLLFWWIATFEPLNRYGDDVQADLGKTERALNALTIATMVDIPQEAKRGLSHFQDFANRAGKTSTPRIVVKWGIGLIYFVLLLLIALVIFMDLQLQLNRLLLLLTILGLISLVLLISFERESRGGSGIGVAFKQVRRVRFLVRASAAILLITAICFGAKVGQLIQNGRSLTVSKF
jgi:hypothetical protein